MEQEFQVAFCLVTLNSTITRIKDCSYISTAKMYAIQSKKNKFILEIAQGLHASNEMKAELSNKLDFFFFLQDVVEPTSSLWNYP